MLPRLRILLYEFATGGGLADLREPERSPWFAEGQAMVRALAADLEAVAGCKVRALCDRRLKLDLPGCQIVPVEGQGGDFEILTTQAAAADWAIVIAPETGGLLESRARAVLAGGGALLGPGPDLIALCGDKQRLAEHLAAAGVPVPPGWCLGPQDAVPAEACFPAVLKPRDGAGSEGVRIVPDAASLPAAHQRSGAWRLERYQPGAAASVACLQGPGGTRLLEPCRQRLLRDGDRLRYAGGHLPLSATLRERASSLAQRAITALPRWHGYLGIDMVLGPQADGSGDVVIEINPRLTTSYVGLRMAAHTNLAEAMLAWAEGHRPEIEFSTDYVYFSATGLVWRGGHSEKLPPGGAMSWLAWDIGGANLKVADGRGFGAAAPFALWREPRQLATALASLLRVAPPAERLAATMTGELADCFETKAQGVHAIVAALEEIAAGRPLVVYRTDGRLVDAQAARQSPELVAAANWHALARFAARYLDGRPGMLVDIGSTTTDIIPIVGHRPAAAGRNDTQRLVSGELVYTGVKRSPVCAIAHAVAYRGGTCPLAQELFATAWDVYLVLGRLPEEPASKATADGRPATREAACRRLARSICSDGETFDEHDARAAAAAIAAEQAALVRRAMMRMIERLPVSPECFVVSGDGEFLARQIVAEVAPGARIISLAERLGPALSQVAPAHALAVLAAESAAG